MNRQLRKVRRLMNGTAGGGGLDDWVWEKKVTQNKSNLWAGDSGSVMFGIWIDVCSRC